jgi:hypothetical protein
MAASDKVFFVLQACVFFAKAVISLENIQISRYALEPAGTLISDGV